MITTNWFDWLIDWFIVLNATFSNILAISWRPVLDGRSWSTRREPPAMGKQLVSFITWGCESSAPLFIIYKAGPVNQTDTHDILVTEILLKVALNTIKSLNIKNNIWLVIMDTNITTQCTMICCYGNLSYNVHDQRWLTE